MGARRDGHRGRPDEPLCLVRRGRWKSVNRGPSFRPCCCGADALSPACPSSHPPATRLITPPLNGQILPGVTRNSLLALARAHADGTTVLPGLPAKLAVEEREFTLSDLKRWSAEGQLLECFGAGTAAVISPVCRCVASPTFGSPETLTPTTPACAHRRIGIPDAEGTPVDVHIPVGPSGLGPIAEGLHARMTAIQTGELEGPAGWKVLCK